MSGRWGQGPLSLRLHRWLGLGLGAFLLVQALSGALLTFRQPLNEMVLPNGPGTTAAGFSAGRAVALLAQVSPDEPVERLFAPRRPGGWWVAWSRGEAAALPRLWYVASDPRVPVFARDALELPGEWVFYLHLQLLSGWPGRLFIGTAGLLGLVIAGTGVWRWWPRQWRHALRVRLRAPRAAMLYDLHRTVGAVSAVLLGIVMFTGAVMATKPFLLGTAFTPRPVLAPVSGWVAAPGDIDAAVSLALEAVPSGRLWSIAFGPDGSTITVVLRDDAALNPRAMHEVVVDAHRRLVARVVTPGAKPVRDRLLAWAFPLHTAEVAGPAQRLVQWTVAVSLTTLAVVGAWLYLQRRPRKKVMAPAPASVEE